MILFHLYAAFVSATLVSIANASPSSRLIEIACSRNPGLEMCQRQFNFRARDTGDAVASSEERFDGKFPRVKFADDGRVKPNKTPLVPVVLPPGIPNNRLHKLMHRVMKDVPLSESDKDELRSLLPLAQSSAANNVPADQIAPEVVATCTAGCTLPHCTIECKCAKTHEVVFQRCNPPATSELADICVNWYKKCPAYHPLEY
uniref:Kazal-like domain-containing protein n=1 Tax=Rhabditophanes sp. KR3021 TaxID=114890 RepID=A0AC35UCZ6_9BILA